MNCIISAWQLHEAELRGYLTRQLGNSALAEDILQNTFLKALSQGDKFCSLDSPRAWLFHVARNQLIDSIRRQRPTVEIDDSFIDQKIETATVETLTDCLPNALSKLSKEDSDVIERCDIEGLAQAEYATQHSLTLSATKSRLQRARKKLKDALQIVCEINYDEDGTVCYFKPCISKVDN